MKVRSIQIKNFRLLRDATLELDDKTTVIVGRNNTGKTSCMALARQMFENETSSYTYNDCPIADRSRALQLFIDFLLGEKTADDCYKEWPTTSLTFLIDYNQSENRSLFKRPLQKCAQFFGRYQKKSQIGAIHLADDAEKHHRIGAAPKDSSTRPL